jgi:repressor LexA
MLTRQQHKLLVFICAYIDRQKVSPSYVEMQEHLGLKSRSGINRLVYGLVERGYIRAIPQRARAIEVLRRPGGKPTKGIALTPNEHRIIAYVRSHQSDIPKFLALCAA